jgi:hypothetical protein
MKDVSRTVQKKLEKVRTVTQPSSNSSPLECKSEALIAHAGVSTPEDIHVLGSLSAASYAMSQFLSYLRKDRTINFCTTVPKLYYWLDLFSSSLQSKTTCCLAVNSGEVQLVA